MCTSDKPHSGLPRPLHHAAFPSDPTLFEALGRHARKLRCEEDRMLFSQGDGPIGLFLVRSGTVQAVVHSGNGKVTAVFYANPGAVLCLPAVVSKEPCSLSALARQGSDIAFLSKDDFDDLLREEPGLLIAVLRVLASEVHSAREALASL